MNTAKTCLYSCADPLEGASLKGISEQDIDHLLVEELQCSAYFLNWFLEQLSESNNFKLPPYERHRLERSASRTGVAGETDILLMLLNKHGHQIANILIENKITAPFTEGQPERYAAAVANERKRGLVSAAVLVAPSKWLAQTDTSCFDATIPYENLCDYFQNAAACERHQELQSRLRFKSYLLNQALVRAKAVNPVNISEPTLCFREYCFNRCREAYKELIPQDMKGEQNIWLNYHVPVGTLRHHTTHHYAGLIFKAPIDQVTNRLQPFLAEDMEVAQVGQGSAVLIRTPPVDKKSPPEQQSDELDKCFAALRRLWHWANDNKSVLSDIKK